jgi:hypothetical protein
LLLAAIAWPSYVLPVWIKEAAKMTDDDPMRLREWRALCKEGRDAQAKADKYLLFDEHGWTTPERIAQHDQLMDRVKEVHKRKEAFIAPFRPPARGTTE